MDNVCQRLGKRSIIKKKVSEIMKTAEQVYREEYPKVKELSYADKLVINLMDKYGNELIGNQMQANASQTSTGSVELVCMCKGARRCNQINGKWICCECNRPLN